ncbi:unnamed protein product [Withania somnifera]
MATPISIQINPSILSFPSNPAKAQIFQPIDKFLFKQKLNSSSLVQLKLSIHQLTSNGLVTAAASGVVDTVEDKLPADIHVTETQEPNSRFQLLVCKDCYKRVHETSKVPGFHPGKSVPEDILVGFVGKQNVPKAAVESILKRTLPHVMSLFIRRHKSLGALKIVTDRGLQVGDVAVIDISVTTIEQDGSDDKSITAAESKGFNFGTEEGDNVLPRFRDSIIGIKRGETKSFPLVFPDSWKQEDLRGVQAQFTVECKELFYRDFPELNDSIADKLLPGCSSIEEVKQALLQRCLEVEKAAKDQATDNAILDQLYKMVEVDIPQSLFEEQGRELYGVQLLQMQANMKLSKQQLASLTSPRAVNEFLETQKENIISIIKQNLAVGDIFAHENLQFSTEELVKEVQNSIQEFQKHQQEYDEDRVKQQVGI